MVKVRNMVSGNGNDVPNQFIIEDDTATYFQSYSTIIVKREARKITLDERYWNYSKTTSKYRSLFLEESTKETERKIKEGVYILENLN